MSSSLPTFAEKDLNYYLRQIRGDFAELEETQTLKVGGPSSQKNIVILLSSNMLGYGNPDLGKKLMRHFIGAISTNRVKPRAIILLNEAIHLALEGSEVLAKLTGLEEQGTRIMVCVTSADEHGAAEKLKVGYIADMDSIADHLLQAWKVIKSLTVPDISMVIPTYNERDGLESLTQKVFAAFDEAGLRGEIVFVDDNSPDGTGALAETLKARYNVKVLHRAGKLGLSSAVIEGFGLATSDLIGVMDADGSHDARILPQMVETVRSRRADLAVGSRYVPGGGVKDWPLFRQFASHVASFIGHLLSPIRDITSGFFVFRRDIIQGVRLNPIGFKILLEIAVMGRFTKFAEVPFVFRDREAGESKFTRKEVMNYFKQVFGLLPYRSEGMSKQRAL